ncbi:uncharacterized protein M6B38_305760 [Iris pallida]|uniref:Uncharacterized protein ycf33 n=1 Tax=Iris pallida TaxID=29817 RepID=A0AAX6G2W7_IRIPA|nr:uncharacterized protein M6B38_387510 [Iris pallida]KAJ6841677.1 uncharacterized protein M6B38_305760 [Iris pallida]
MKVCALQLNTHIPSPKAFSRPKLPSKRSPVVKLMLSTKTTITTATTTTPLSTSVKTSLKLSAAGNTARDEDDVVNIPRWVVVGGASLGLSLLLLGLDGQHVAMAFGPEGPLVEEFWDNMRRYGLYILTVSTGVIYAVFQPIVELLRNPITAILIIVVVAGGGYLLSQVLNAMVGISEFSYNYGY